jgi:hypothetical protein
MLATGTWCAAGATALPAGELTSSRIVVLAPPWLLVAVLGIAWLLPACRRSPILASPALLSVVPWVPISLPAVAFAWTGRLAWVPVGLAVVALLRATWAGRSTHSRSPGRARPLRGAVVAGALTAAVLMATASLLGARLPGGDEPHYLIITQSLLKDGDLQIENNHKARDYAPYFHGTLDPDFLHRGRNEVIYSIHAPGLPVLVAPGFAAFGYRGAQATVMLTAVLTGALVWIAAWLATRSVGAAWFAWAAIAGCVTFLVQGVSIFPDGPAATIVAGSTVLVLLLENRTSIGARTLVLWSATLALLPFLHTRLATISVGIGLVVFWHVATEDGRSAAERRARVLAFSIAPLIGLAAWLGYFQILYGTPNPAVAYGTHPETRLAYVPGGILGLFFDQDFGLLPFAPVLSTAAVAWCGRAKLTGRQLLPAAVLYLAAVGTYWMWWAGMPATPARLAAAILPIAAPALAVTWHRSTLAGRTAMTGLLAASMAISLLTICVDQGSLAWNAYDAQAPWLHWMNTSVDLPRGFPSFFWNLDPGVASSEWPFAIHVFTVAAAIVGVAVGARAVARRAAAPCAVGVWAVAIGFMACLQVGWWLNGSSALRPVGGQLPILQAMAAGRAARVVTLGGLRRATMADVRVDVPRGGLATPAGTTWAPLPSLPAGQYQVTIAERRPVGGSLTVRFGESDADRIQIDLEHQNEQATVLTVPPGASSVSFNPDPILAGVAQRLSLRPIVPTTARD